jgi:hypothetical protein
MPDITMCKPIYCPLKDTCYRYKAKPDQYQSFFSEQPYNDEKKTCEQYWKMSSQDEATKSKRQMLND